MISLTQLLVDMPVEEIYGTVDREINKITYDSRNVEKGDLFVAIKGFQYDGHQFINEAITRGASVVVSERTFKSPRATVIKVANSRKALAILSGNYYGWPSRRMRLIGVTGTNGKTTTCYLISSMLEEAGYRTGLLGTIEYRIGDRSFGEGKTTPESLELNSFFKTMVEEGVQFAVLEVSSHALALDRVHGLDFRTAIFTNLSQDHLDFHKDMDTYLKTKSLLFENLKPGVSTAIVNGDDPATAFIISRTRADVVTYSSKGKEVELWAETVKSDKGMRKIKVRSTMGEFELCTQLPGQYNVSNILAAAATGMVLGVKREAIISGIGKVKNVRGRLERVDCGQDFDVYVDFAHSPDALAHCLQAVRELAQGRILVVFGCGGERDIGKRKKMGTIAERLSDVIILTSDNPRGEDPESIIADIDEGIRDKSKREIVVDRKQAINRALTLAQKSDTVLLAGKGHETYQEIGQRRIPFNDRQVVEELLGSVK